MLPLSDPEAELLLEPLAEDERLASWRLVRKDGTIVGYAWRRGRAPDAAYRFLARHRDLLGRLVPDGPAPRRFP